MNLSFAIMAHPKRKKQAELLQSKLDCEIIWDTTNREWDTGQRALGCDLDAEWLCIIQDDAIVGENFYTNLVNAIDNVPTKSLISLYTGTVRPNTALVTAAVNKAKLEKASWLKHKTLLWGVAIVIPTEDIVPMLEYVKYSRLPYDFRIGSYYQHVKKPVYYTNPSIADHDWQTPSLTGHDRKPAKRVAHNYSDELISWNKSVVDI